MLSLARCSIEAIYSGLIPDSDSCGSWPGTVRAQRKPRFIADESTRSVEKELAYNNFGKLHLYFLFNMPRSLWPSG